MELAEFGRRHQLSVDRRERWHRRLTITAPKLLKVELRSPTPTTSHPIWAAIEPVDMRKGFDGLGAVVRQTV